MKRFAIVLLHLYIIMGPFAIFFPRITMASTGFNPIRVVTLAIVGIAFFWTLRSRYRHRIGLSGGDLLVLAFLATVVASSTRDFVGTQQAVFVPVLSCIGFLYIMAHANLESPTMGLYRTIALTAIGCGIGALLFRFGLIGVPSFRLDEAARFETSRTTGLFDSNQGMWGLLVAFILPTVSSNKMDKILALATLAFSWVLLMSAQFRVLIAVSALITLIGLARAWRVREYSILLIVPLFASLLTVFIAADYTPDVFNEVMDRFYNVVEERPGGVGGYEVGESYAARQEENEISRGIIAEYPWFGYGWEVINQMTLRTSDMPLYGHNMYFAWPVRVGIPLSLGILGATLGLLLVSWRQYRAVVSETGKGLYFYAMVAIACVLLVGFVNDMTRMAISFPCLAVFIYPAFKKYEDERVEPDELELLVRK